MINNLEAFQNNINDVCKQCNVTLNHNQYDSMCSLCFNVGLLMKVCLNSLRQTILKE